MGAAPWLVTVGDDHAGLIRPPSRDVWWPPTGGLAPRQNEPDAPGVPIAAPWQRSPEGRPLVMPPAAAAVRLSRRLVMSHHAQQGRCGSVNFSAHSPQTCRAVSEPVPGQAADLQPSWLHPW